MTHVATLVGAPGAEILTADLLAAAAKRLPGAGEPVILSAGEAADIPFAPGAAHGNRDDGAFADAAYCRAASSVLRLGLGEAPVPVAHVMGVNVIRIHREEIEEPFRNGEGLGR